MMIDVTDASFQTDVLERSMTTPVVVDLWAPWCGPCKTLGPLLEKVVDETDGKVVLAKINVDENMQASAAFRVQSIPAVYAVSGGQVVDGFIGAQPEAAIREFVGRLTAGANDAELAMLVAEGDEDSLREALKLEAGHLPAVLALGRLLIDAGRHGDALEVLEAVDGDDDEVTALAAEARSGALPAGERERIESRLTELLDQVKADDEARQEFVELLEELAVGSPEDASAWRRKLSTRLF